MTTKKPEPKATKTKYEPTAKELGPLHNYDSRLSAQTAPRLKVKADKTLAISPDHPDQSVGWRLVMEALGTADADFAKGLVQQLANAGLQGDKIDEAGLNFLLSVIKDVKPKDHLEAMLVAHMAVIHVNTMEFARRLPIVETLQEQDSTERTLNKLTRTFTIQLEALKRYRSGGQLQVTVQNVSVSEGGQAIVGNVTQAARETAPEPATSPPALTDARMAPMQTIDNEERSAALPRGQENDRQSST